jgi:hypothetical protein
MASASWRGETPRACSLHAERIQFRRPLPAIDCNDGDHAAKIIQHALGIESDDVANYVFPKT